MHVSRADRYNPLARGTRRLDVLIQNQLSDFIRP
jgi:hypothetical protein